MKIIPFYLPQFHEIPENDSFWGKGFTEWTNVRKAVPLYEGHRQPVVPYEKNYYNLLNPDVLKWQADLANSYGIYGFCIYHYWIQGRKLLEKPLELLLEHKEIPLRYCISWANHNWTDSWSGNNTMLIAQTYGGEEDWDAHFDYLLPFFQDERYIRNEEGKVLLLIFNPEDIPHLNDMLDHLQKRAAEAGLPGIAFAYQNYYFGMKKNRDDSRFTYGVEHQPAYAFSDNRSGAVMAIRQYGYKFLSWAQRTFKVKINIDHTKLEIMQYTDVWDKILKRIPTDDKRIPGAFTGWDSTPRKGEHGLVVEGGSPEKFKEYLTKQIKRAREVYHKDMIFVAAWNEWAEGSMLEPDEYNGFGYLEAVRDALKANDEYPGQE
ncbi:MAG: glycoside hydrolase family 99-like domain-containing protein [Lachnospiraceae bacterium]|nr:glycoside hydrolase family 99-like domain-containing protein [Lachnospiraceae bacterium]